MSSSNEAVYQPTKPEDIPSHLKDFSALELDEIAHSVGRSCYALEQRQIPKIHIIRFMVQVSDAEIVRRRANRLLPPEKRKTTYWFVPASWSLDRKFEFTFYCLTDEDARKVGLKP